MGESSEFKVQSSNGEGAGRGRWVWVSVIAGVLLVLVGGAVVYEVQRRKRPDAFEGHPLLGRSAANLRLIWSAMGMYGMTYAAAPKPVERWHPLLKSGKWLANNMGFEHPNVDPASPAYFYVPDLKSRIVVVESVHVRERIGGGRLALLRDGTLTLVGEGELQGLELVPCVPEGEMETR